MADETSGVRSFQTARRPGAGATGAPGTRAGATITMGSTDESAAKMHATTRRIAPAARMPAKWRLPITRSRPPSSQSPFLAMRALVYLPCTN